MQTFLALGVVAIIILWGILSLVRYFKKGSDDECGCGGCGKGKLMAILATAVLLASCEKEVGINAVYKLTTRVQQDEKSELLYTDKVVGYCFYVDTMNYYIKDYSEAISGKLSSKTSQPQIDFNIKGEYDDTSKALLFKGINTDNVMMVVCDTENQIYSYRKAAIGIAMDTIFVSLNILPWKFIDDPKAKIKVNNWMQSK